MAIRKNVKDLTNSEKTQLIDAIKALKANGKYDQYVLRHAQAPSSNIHRCPAFLPWHRQFLLEYEKELQDISGNSDLGLPYWNWTEDMSTGNPANGPVWANNLLGGNGDPTDNNIVKTGPFRQGEWTIVNSSGNPAGPLIREFGDSVATLSTQADVNDALNTTPYDASPWSTGSIPSHRNRLEGWYGESGPGLHNRAHVWVGGSMLPMTSPNDPVFFLHHCFVDKIWADWQDQHPSEGYQPVSGGSPGQNINDPMESTVSGNSTTPADVWNISALGYSYDTSGSSSGSGSGGSGGSDSSGSGSGSGGGSGPCFVATATMGDYNHPTVQQLREFRDKWLLKRTWGQWFVNFYYEYGSYPAKAVHKSKWLRKACYYMIIKPLSVVAKAILKS